MPEAKKPEFEVIIRLRQGDCGDQNRDADPTRDVFSVWIKGHSICQLGKPYRVAYTGEKVVKDGVQIRGNLLALLDFSDEYDGPSKKLSKRDWAYITECVSKWQADPAAMEASRNDCEECW